MDKIEDICCLLTGMLHLKDASGYVWGKLEEGTTCRGLYSSLYRHIHAYKILLILASGAQVFFFALALRPGGIMAPQIGGFCGSVAF